jgi:thioredoxin-dependent peroxiredoxin
LADTDAKLCNAFGVISDKNMYGKMLKGVTRSTFLIDASGKIVKVWPKVKVEGHAQDVLDSLP